MALSEHDGVVSGRGTYSIDPPRSTPGTFRVEGTFRDAAVILLIIYDVGTTQTFEGGLEGGSQITGTVTYRDRDGQPRSFPMTYFRVGR